MNLVAKVPDIEKFCPGILTEAMVSILSDFVIFMVKIILLLSSEHVKLPVHSLGINSNAEITPQGHAKDKFL